MPEEMSLNFPEILKLPGETVLEIGPRDLGLTKRFLALGKRVMTVDPLPLDKVSENHSHACMLANPFFVSNSKRFDVIVASHVLEHVMDKQSFLEGIRNALTPDGTFVCIVPPLKHDVVGGHVNLFNMGLLMYNLILAGFDCRQGSFVKRDYNLCAFVKASKVPLPDLKYDRGDIETLEAFFPVKVWQGFDGNDSRLNVVNWPPKSYK